MSTQHNLMKLLGKKMFKTGVRDYPILSRAITYSIDTLNESISPDPFNKKLNKKYKRIYSVLEKYQDKAPEKVLRGELPSILYALIIWKLYIDDVCIIDFTGKQKQYLKSESNTLGLVIKKLRNLGIQPVIREV